MRTSSFSLLLMILAVQLGCGSRPDRPSDFSVPSDNSIEWTDVGVAKFRMPKGWTGNQSSGNTVMILTRVGADMQNPDEMISIDVGPATMSTAAETAKAFADKFSGSMFRFPRPLDGEEAFQVTIPPQYEKVMPRDCVVTHHNGKACLIIGGSKSKESLVSALYDLTRIWKWK